MLARYLSPILLLALFAPAAHAMRCGSNLVTEGAQDFQVRQRCGDPFWTDRYTSVEVFGAYGPVEQQREVQFDVWYYNFGPRDLLRKLLFRDGVLVREETLGYGVDEIGANCNAKLPITGLSAGELYARCGEPASRRVQSDTIVRRPAPGVERWRDQRREEWVYDFGDRSFVRIVRLVNGRVDSVESVNR
jgi:hypothetical protein